MRKDLLPAGLRAYKANLHCHSTFSDGHLTVEQLKQGYQQAGYSIIAFSDHDHFYPHNALTDANFLALNAFEADISENSEPSGHIRRCYHLCCFAKTDGEDYKEILPTPDYQDKDAINAYIRELNARGFLVQYNHPNWSLQQAEDLRNIHGLWGMEIFNFSATIDGIDGNQGFMYDVLLRDGNRLFCTATDDNHNHYPFGHEQCDSFGGFTVILAERLDYPSVIDALERGNFYASEGPQIHALYVEDGKIHVSCSPARHIRFTTDGRSAKSINAVGNAFVNGGSFELQNEYAYVRVQITGPDGTMAHSNAYWLS